MEPTPTDELRVRKAKGTSVDSQGYSCSDGLSAGTVIAVQRKWMVDDGEPTTTPTNRAVLVKTEMQELRWQKRKEEWRDLPEAD